MRIPSAFLALVVMIFLTPLARAEQYSARNADWPHRLEELTLAREKLIKAQGFEVKWANEKVMRADNGHEPLLRMELGLPTEDQKDCALREIMEVQTFLKESKYQKYLKARKVTLLWLSILDNSNGKLDDAQLKYGPQLVHAGYDIDGKESLPQFSSPVLIIRAVLNSKRSCVFPTYENLALSFDWWDQSEPSN